MLNNNMFSTGFNSGFGSGFSNGGDDTIKPITKKEKYPGLNAEQIQRLEDSVSGLTGAAKTQQLQKNYKAMIQIINDQNINDNRASLNNERFKNSLNKKDPRECQFDQSACRQSDLVDLVKQVKHLKATTSEDTVMEKLMQEMELKGISMDSLNNYLDKGDETFLYEMGLAEKTENKWKNRAIGIGVGAGTLGLLDAGLYGAGATSERLGKKIYESPIDSSMQEARQIQKAGVQVKDAEVAVKDAKADLKAAKKTGEGVEEAEKALANAEKELAAAKSKKVVKVADTAREYNVGGWVLEGWSAESRGIQAKSKANQIFKKTINPALENSKSTINVQELINSLEDDIQQLAKNDPDKLKAYNEALESLKDSYKAPEFAEYSLKDSQTLKSGLQGRTPQKFWKGKEITNELQELKGKLSSKLTNAVHSNLTKEVGEDTAKLYKDWANLTQYADDMAKQSTNAGLKQGFGNFWSSAYHKLTDGASAKAGLLLNKGGEMLKKATNPKVWVDKAGDLIKSVRKNPKVLLKGLKAISPGDLLMPDYSYSAVKERGGLNPGGDKLKEWVDKHWGTEITENEWKGLLGEEGYSIIDENGNNSLEEKGWTQEGILALLDSLE